MINKYVEQNVQHQLATKNVNKTQNEKSNVGKAVEELELSHMLLVEV